MKLVKKKKGNFVCRVYYPIFLAGFLQNKFFSSERAKAICPLTFPILVSPGP